MASATTRSSNPMQSNRMRRRLTDIATNTAKRPSWMPPRSYLALTNEFTQPWINSKTVITKRVDVPAIDRWHFAYFGSAALCAGPTAERGQVEGGCTEGHQHHPWRQGQDSGLLPDQQSWWRDH